MPGGEEEGEVGVLRCGQRAPVVPTDARLDVGAHEKQLAVGPQQRSPTAGPEPEDGQVGARTYRIGEPGHPVAGELARVGQDPLRQELVAPLTGGFALMNRAICSAVSGPIAVSSSMCSTHTSSRDSPSCCRSSSSQQFALAFA